MLLQLPYGKGYLAYDFPEESALLQSGVEAARTEGQALVRAAMAAPIGSAPLEALAKGKKKAVVILSDHTRPVPSRDILPPMLEALRKGNPAIDITLLVATGCHRPTTAEELRKKLGGEIYENEHIEVHMCRDAKNHLDLGELPSGARLIVNRMAAECDLLVAEGFIEPHFFAGFSGGRKAVLPGLCDLRTVLGNHAGDLIAHPCARTGILEGNPIHADMVAAARMAKLAYIVNVVLDHDKRTTAAFAGDFEKAHEAGCAWLRKGCAVRAVPGDIVVTTNGGAPLDQNIYQCVKGLTAAEASAKEGAVLIMCAECADGTGGEAFFRALADCASPAALEAQCIATPRDRTLPDQWEGQILARILAKHTVIFVSEPKWERTLCDMKISYAPDMDAAMKQARHIRGEKASVTVIPDGVGVIVEE